MSAGGGKTVKSLHELLAAKNGGGSVVAPSTSLASSVSIQSSFKADDQVPYSYEENNDTMEHMGYDEYLPNRHAAKATVTNEPKPTPRRMSQNINPEFESELRNSTLIDMNPSSNTNASIKDDDANLDQLQSHSSQHFIRTEEQEEEEEMPSSSFTVLGDDSDLLKLLSGANTPLGGKVNIEVPQIAKNEEIIELYSTIAMLKKENAELTKELEFVKKSKDAMLNDQQQKHDAHVIKLRSEINEQQATVIRAQRERDDMEREMEMMKSDLECLIREKQDLEQNMYRSKDDSGTIKSELSANKIELNKIKMELARVKSENERMLNENRSLNDEIQKMLDQKEQQDRTQESEFRDLQLNLRKAEEQALQMKNECLDKNQHIGRLTSDLQSLDRNLNGAISENAALKQRISQLEMSERELVQAKYHISTLENDYRNLQSEIGQLRSQQQQASVNSMYSVPPPSRVSYQPSPSPPVMPVHQPYQPPPAPTSSYSSSYEPSSYNNTSYGRDSVPTSRSSYGSGSRGYEEQPSYGSSSYGASKEPQKGSNASSLASIVGGGPGKTPKSLSSALGDMSEIRKSLNQQYDSYDNRPIQKSSEGNSLGNLLHNKGGNKYHDESTTMSITGEGRRKSLGQVLGGGGGGGSTPFATERTAAEMMSSFDGMERDLTRLMTEKTSLQDESERLHTRGLKTLTERTRLQKVEARLEELNKDISQLRKKLSAKPG